jgi:hypothetical protein
MYDSNISRQWSDVSVGTMLSLNNISICLMWDGLLRRNYYVLHVPHSNHARHTKQEHLVRHRNPECTQCLRQNVGVYKFAYIENHVESEIPSYETAANKHVICGVLHEKLQGGTAVHFQSTD